jgi:hypothetical protein
VLFLYLVFVINIVYAAADACACHGIICASVSVAEPRASLRIVDIGIPILSTFCDCAELLSLILPYLSRYRRFHRVRRHPRRRYRR